MFKQGNLKYLDNNNNLNISYLSLIKEISYQTTSFNKSKESVNGKNKKLKGFNDSNFNRQQSADLSNSYISNYLSYINANMLLEYYAIRNSILNSFSFNSFFMPQLYPFYYLNQLNYFYSCLNNNILNISNTMYNNAQIIPKKKEPPPEPALINRKRKPDKSISMILNKIQINSEVKKERKNLFVVRIKKKYILTIKYIDIKKEYDEEEDKKMKSKKSKKIKKKINSETVNNKKYSCEHIGCKSCFDTKKLGIFHHFKMSPECQEDSIYLLKLIFETKKLLLKNIEKNEIIFGKLSSLYEEAMKGISLDEYIKIYAGLKIKDNL